MANYFANQYNLKFAFGNHFLTYAEINNYSKYNQQG